MVDTPFFIYSYNAFLMPMVCLHNFFSKKDLKQAGKSAVYLGLFPVAAAAVKDLFSAGRPYRYNKKMSDPTSFPVGPTFLFF
ncbi:hypothetical protein ALO_00865 [Acetonema longum DSM 6540]|uniref:Uncharacterized protein n=1 Tax=Acetonema longum DSM 6540 TaxID=1009370 RepID=F7NDR6_9FIRM|nr:hypothetical protein ALO_00865 [Acetonema longum DSM 6540]